MNIGEVLDQLRPDFPGITIPKIRFLEDKGLIKPERTAAGYRKFSARRRRAAALRAADAARPLPAAQGDRRAPRRDRPRPGAAADRAGRADRARRSRWPPTACRAPSRSSAATTCGSRARELLKIAEISEELLDQLEQYGLVTARPGTGHYDTDALVIAQTARELADFGFEPRHLRAFKTAADREVGLVEQVVAPHKARPRRRRQGPRRGDRQRDRRAVGAAARHPGQGRAALAPEPAGTARPGVG